MSPQALSYSKKRISSFYDINKYRRYRILEIIQYTILYVLITLAIAPRLDSLFPEFDEKKSYNRILIETVLQLVAVSVTIFYVRKIVKIIPPIGLLLDKAYNVGTTPDYNGGIVMGLVLVHSQKHLTSKISFLVHNLDRYVATWVYPYPYEEIKPSVSTTIV